MIFEELEEILAYLVKEATNWKIQKQLYMMDRKERIRYKKENANSPPDRVINRKRQGSLDAEEVQTLMKNSRRQATLITPGQQQSKPSFVANTFFHHEYLSMKAEPRIPHFCRVYLTIITLGLFENGC